MKVQVKNNLVKEKKKLDEKLMGLNNFIRSVAFMDLTTRHRSLLESQATYMTKYSQVLRDRIIDITSQEEE